MRGWAEWTIRNNKPTWRRSNVGTIGTSWWWLVLQRLYDHISSVSVWTLSSILGDKGVLWWIKALEVGELWIIWSSLISLQSRSGGGQSQWAGRSESGKNHLKNIPGKMLTLPRVWLMGEFIIIISHNCISPSSYILITVPDLTLEVWFTAASPATRLISATHIQTGTSSILRKLISNDYNIPAFTDWAAARRENASTQWIQSM